MTDEKFAELIEINLYFAKSELCQMTDVSAPARALRHIEEALKDLRARKPRATNTKMSETKTA